MGTPARDQHSLVTEVDLGKGLQPPEISLWYE